MRNPIVELMRRVDDAEDKHRKIRDAIAQLDRIRIAVRMAEGSTPEEIAAEVERFVAETLN